MKHSEILENLISQFAKLPGIGKKSARRLAYHVIRQNRDKVLNLSDAIVEAKEKLHLCRECYNLTEDEICPICKDQNRDRKKILVVENFHDLYLFENLSIFDGLYHVLGGVLNPLDGIGPDSLKLEELFERIKDDNTQEIIIGLSSSIEGDTTALYIGNRLQGEDVIVSKLASGIPVGGEIEYTDEITLRQALENRKGIDNQ